MMLDQALSCSVVGSLEVAQARDELARADA